VPYRIQAPQPPTPGLPLQAPSVHISTVGRSLTAHTLDAGARGTIDAR